MTLKEKILMARTRLMGLLSQEELNHNPHKTVTPGMPELLRQVAAEGAVLLQEGIAPEGRGVLSAWVAQETARKRPQAMLAVMAQQDFQGEQDQGGAR